MAGGIRTIWATFSDDSGAKSWMAAAKSLMVGSMNRSIPRRMQTPRARLARFGGLVLAVIVTVASLFVALPEGVLASTWILAIAWTVMVQLTLALMAGFRDGDWSGFQAPEEDDDPSELCEWSSRRGRYQYLSDMDEQFRAAADRLH